MRRASALAQVVSRIRAQGADVVLIGAAAMAGHGAARSTGDVDLLCVDRRVLRSSAWPPSDELSADVRFGDVDDPLDGVVRSWPVRRHAPGCPCRECRSLSPTWRISSC